MTFKVQEKKEETRRPPKETGRVLGEEGGSREGRQLGRELMVPCHGQCTLPTLPDPQGGRQEGWSRAAGSILPTLLDGFDKTSM